MNTDTKLDLLRRVCQYIEGKEDVRMMSAMTDGKRLYCDVLERICEIQEAAEAQGPRAGALRWTREKPKVAGFYWCLVPGTEDLAVHQFVEDENGLLFEPAEYVDEIVNLSDFNPNCKWAGPIPEPEALGRAPAPCPRCYGGGLIINMEGDPDDCPKCGAAPGGEGR